MRKLPGYSRLQTLFVNTITGASSAFVLAGSRGPSTRELASNEYPGSISFCHGNPGDVDFSSPKPRPLCSTSYKICRKPIKNSKTARVDAQQSISLTQHRGTQYALTEREPVLSRHEHTATAIQQAAMAMGPPQRRVKARLRPRLSARPQLRTCRKQQRALGWTTAAATAACLIFA